MSTTTLSGFNTAGTYTITAEVTGVDGLSYHDTRQVVVLDAAVFDALLREKWNAMKGFLNGGNVSSALSYIHPRTGPAFNVMFTNLVAQFLSILVTHTGLNFVEMHDDYAEYELDTLEGGILRSYEVVYRKDSSGLWRIKDF